MLTCILKNKVTFLMRRTHEMSTTVSKKKMSKPEDWIAEERARQAAIDKLPLSIYSEVKSFSKTGQKTRSSKSIKSSAAGSFATYIERWLNTVPILNLKDCQWQKGQKKWSWQIYTVKYGIHKEEIRMITIDRKNLRNSILQETVHSMSKIEYEQELC